MKENDKILDNFFHLIYNYLMNMQKCKLQKQSTDGTISVTVPKKFIKILGWKPQDIVTFVLEGFQIKMFKDEEDVQQTAKGSDSEIKG